MPAHAEAGDGEKATEKSLHRVLLAGRERHREGMRRLHAYLWSKHAAAREPVGTLAVLGQVESLELGLFGDAQRPEEQLQSEKDTGGRYGREPYDERDAA